MSPPLTARETLIARERMLRKRGMAIGILVIATTVASSIVALGCSWSALSDPVRIGLTLGIGIMAIAFWLALMILFEPNSGE